MTTVPHMQMELVSGWAVFEPRWQDVNVFWFRFGYFGRFDDQFSTNMPVKLSPVWEREWDAEEMFARKDSWCGYTGLLNHTKYLETHTISQLSICDLFFPSAPPSPVSHSIREEKLGDRSPCSGWNYSTKDVKVAKAAAISPFQQSEKKIQVCYWETNWV